MEKIRKHRKKNRNVENSKDKYKTKINHDKNEHKESFYDVNAIDKVDTIDDEYVSIDSYIPFDDKSISHFSDEENYRHSLNQIRPFNNSSDKIVYSSIFENNEIEKILDENLLSGPFTAREKTYLKKLIEVVGLRITYISAKMHRTKNDIIQFLCKTKNKINYKIGKLDIKTIDKDLLFEIIRIEWSHCDQLIFIESFDKFGDMWELYRIAGLSNKSISDIKLYHKYYQINNDLHKNRKKRLNKKLKIEFYNEFLDKDKILNQSKDENKTNEVKSIDMNKANLSITKKRLKNNQGKQKRGGKNKKIDKRKKRTIPRKILEEQEFMKNWSLEERRIFSRGLFIQHQSINDISKKLKSKTIEEVVMFNDQFFKKLTKKEKLDETKI
ncbi:hypothetical protein DMUE_4861 [Dictyocoela muelleri]|nr:hypothetical protein DMUE_4861 [Dictyocoela muelleri]